MEVSFYNDILNPSYTPEDNLVLSSETSSNMVAFTNNRDGYLQITNGEQIDVALDNVDFGNEVTVTFWAQGNAEVLPFNTYLFDQ